MASYKSQSNLARRMDEQPPYSRRTTTARLPQRSVTPSTAVSQVPALGPSKLQKRRPSRDEVPATRGVTGQRAPTPKAPVALGSHQGGAISTVPIVQTSQRQTAPKYALQNSSRLPKPEISTATRTPSLVSGSSTSTIDSPRSNLLRRKQTSIGIGGGREDIRTQGDPMYPQEKKYIASGIPGGYKDPFSETVLGISIPSTSAVLAHPEAELEPPEHSHYVFDTGSTEVLSPPAPHHALSTTPSTRYSESPGPFSVSSTPTSMSSYSPGVAISTKTTLRTRQVSPLQGRPPVVRYRTPEERALPSVSEPTVASISASTVRLDTNRPNGSSQSERLPTFSSGLASKTTQTRLPTSHRQVDAAKIGVTRGLRRPSQNSEEKPQVQAPPELAHLADQPSPNVAPRRPARPSRDGTPDITGFHGPSPIIQSNMISFPSSHRRTTSTGSTASVAMNSKTRFGIMSPKQTSRNPSPNPSLTSSFASNSRIPTRGPTPDLSSEKQRSSTLPTPAAAPSPSKTSRFGFFSRRAKTEPTAPAAKSEKKLHRRGPAAGTGHEGYGRYAVRGKHGSATSGSSIGKSPSAATTTESLDRSPSTRKSSVTSTTSTEMDDFLLERLNPVVIRGNGSSSELTMSPDPLQSTSSLDVSSSQLKQLNTTNKDPAMNDMQGTRPALLPSAMSDSVHGMSPVKRMPLGLRRPSESEEEVKKSFIPSFAAKRASRTSNPVDSAPSTNSNPSKTAKVSSSGPISETKEGAWRKSSKKEKGEQEALKPPRKWNFFQRAHGAPRVPTPAVEASASPPVRTPLSRSVAHYAIVDTQSGLDANDIEMIMQEPDSTPEEASIPVPQGETTVSDTQCKDTERLPSMLLPPKPILPDIFTAPGRPASPKVFLRPLPESQPKLTLDTSITEQAHRAPPSVADLTPVTDLSPTSSPVSPLSPVKTFEPIVPKALPVPVVLPSPPATLSPIGPPPSNPPPRPSRLAQIGRIPQVISTRQRAHGTHSRSFSRPFAMNRPGDIAASRTSFDSTSPMTVTAGPAEPYPILHGLNALTHGTAIATMSPSAEESMHQGEFFVFPSRKGSEVSYSSSSGTWSFPATAGTATVPIRGAPQSEDEVWNEYDDLIDEVLSPIDSQNAVGSEYGQNQSSLEPLPLSFKHSRASSHSAATTMRVSNASLHLRRSRLLAVLHSQSPTSSISLSEFLNEYGDRNISVVDPISGRLSFPSTARMSISSGPRNRASSNRSSLPASLNLSSRQSKATVTSSSDRDRNSAGANKYRDTRLMEMAETRADGLSSMANLRFGALMTSKWLSFGRVIFSPAHFDLKDPEHDRILVIDGLGKDWSYYCALTYPEATVYNLGPGQTSTTTTTTTGSATEPWSTLDNHRHFGYSSLGDPFPFSKGSFACVVLRFPSAVPTSVHRSVISECKRVLRPGGFLELSVLDLDLVNMGNRARRAVRGLKVKMQVADEDVSLRNISDEIMGLVGKNGFTECNRCFVGVPVAGILPVPDDADASASKKRKGSTTSTINKPIAATTKTAQQHKPKPEVSFSDLLNTRASSESTDNTIADMVARVGRWWYSRCYESLVLPEAGEPEAANSGDLLRSSIWRDESLISECEKRGTSFRLLIGYAQKPEVGVRRTVSV